MSPRRNPPLFTFFKDYPFPLALLEHDSSATPVNMRTVDVVSIKFPEILVSTRLSRRALDPQCYFSLYILPDPWLLLTTSLFVMGDVSLVDSVTCFAWLLGHFSVRLATSW